MRILMLAQFYHPIIGGEERHTRNLAAALARRGHSVSVATLRSGELPEREVDQGVEVFRISGLTQSWRGLYSDGARRHAPPFPDPGLSMALRDIVASRRIEVVHAHNWLLHSFLPLKRPTGPRLVVTLHDLSLVCATKTAMRGGEPCDGPGLAKCVACAAQHYGKAKGLVTLAANWADSAVERRLVDCFLPVSKAIMEGSGLADGPTPYEIIPNFIPDEVATLEGEADERLDQLPAQPFILFVGDLRRFKGVDVLIEAYSGLSSAPPLVLIGRKCQDMPTRWPADVHVFHDWPHAAVMHAWKRCMLGVLPSVGPEACATVLMEGIASGKPMIASATGGNPDIIEDNVNGLLVRPGDRRGLAEAIAAMCGDEALRRRLGAGALRTAPSFMASNVVPRIERVYEEAMARRLPAVHAPHASKAGGLLPGPLHCDAAFGFREIGGDDGR
jgi:glycosyltransferase involved in cell wall biosynthesis